MMSWAGGVGEGVRSEERSDATPHPLMYEWMALITSLHTLRGMKLLQMGLLGIGGRGGTHRLSGGMKPARVKSTRRMFPQNVHERATN